MNLLGSSANSYYLFRFSHLVSILFLLSLSSLCSANEPILDEEFFYVKIDDCGAMGEVCIDIPFGDTPNYEFTVDGTPYSGMLAGCNIDTIYNYGYADVPTPGPYFLDSWYINNNLYSGDFPDMFALVDSMNLWDPEGNWEINTMSQLLIGGKPGHQYSAMIINMLLLNSPTQLDFNLGIMPSGSLFSFESGLHEVVILESLSGCLDTFTVAVDCAQIEEVNINLMLGENETHCLDFSELPGFPQSVSNIHADDPDPVASYSFVNGNSCIQVDALSNGLDTACIVYCDQFNFCDTTFIYVTVSDGLMHTIDTTFVDIQVYTGASFCFLDELNGNAVSAILGCEGSGDAVIFSALDAMDCVDYSGDEIGTDQICVVFTDNLGNTHTAYFIVTVTPPTSEIIQETVLLGNTYDDCFDTSELNGNIVNVEDICAVNNNSAVNFDINNVSLCLEAQTAFIGEDTSCIVICDDQGVCDTTIYIITVVENLQIPLLSNDALMTNLNGVASIDLCENDQFNGLPITNFYIVQNSSNGNGSENGLVAINQGCSITYTPNEDYCGNDSFEYAVCNENGCDTAMVIIQIECGNAGSGDDLLVYNGFSPNMDGDNEFFTIRGINNYPGNVLRVYNRWGVIVYKTFEYQNDWRGTWAEDDLPDGTYYYALDLANGDIKTGYVQIHR